MKIAALFFTTILAITSPLMAANIGEDGFEQAAEIQCGNLVYADNMTSVCFADKFLTRVASDTTIRAAKKFTPVRLDSPDLFKFPFVVFSGDKAFELSETERQNLKKYLLSGGFLLSSPGCSDPKWDASFRRELELIFPNRPLKNIPMSHVIFQMVYDIPRLTLKSGGTTLVEGLEIDGRIVAIHSREGLNDVTNAKGCCCCGGDMVRESQLVNVNIFTYALLY